VQVRETVDAAGWGNQNIPKRGVRVRGRPFGCWAEKKHPGRGPGIPGGDHEMCRQSSRVEKNKQTVE